MSPSNQRDEVMKMCLTSSPGDYKPVSVDASVGQNSQVQHVKPPKQGNFARHVKKHIPGKAGGGWESSGSEKEEPDQLEMMEALSVKSVHSPGPWDE